ncbi:hypothetical protein FA95DRAFT_482670 [Auriscalpium vulgare]|uniref:Uncharacterized protein n=1 Tax=Auriscalpium vulgare TaxID=40419 RepID=A0ACB8SB98_9AGAM|nr:hypothetical protein FA95DRAFT_482670 [Auriscalpium vulgare]
MRRHLNFSPRYKPAASDPDAASILSGTTLASGAQSDVSSVYSGHTYTQSTTSLKPSQEPVDALAKLRNMDTRFIVDDSPRYSLIDGWRSWWANGGKARTQDILSYLIDSAAPYQELEPHSVFPGLLKPHPTPFDVEFAAQSSWLEAKSSSEVPALFSKNCTPGASGGIHVGRAMYNAVNKHISLNEPFSGDSKRLNIIVLAEDPNLGNHLGVKIDNRNKVMSGLFNYRRPWKFGKEPEDNRPKEVRVHFVWIGEEVTPSVNADFIKEFKE